MVYKWMLMAAARVNSWRDWVVIALSTWGLAWPTVAQHVECLHGWLHSNYSSCWCTWRVNAIHGKNCCMDHIFFFRSFLAYTTPSLSKLLQALGQAFQMNDFELKTHRIFLFYFYSLTKWAGVKQVGSSCIWSHLVWPNRLHGFFSFLWKSIKSSRNSNNKSSGDCPMSSKCSRIFWLGTPGAPPCCD